MRAESAHVGPVVAETAGEFRQQRVFFQRFIDAVEVVGHGRQVAARQLRALRAGVEQRGRARHEVEGRQHFVELDRAGFAVDLAQRQAHRDTHIESLRHFDADFIDVQEVAVVQRLQAEVVELQVAVGLERSAQLDEVELQQLLVEQAGLHALLDEGREVLGVASQHVGVQQLFADDFLADRVQQQAGRGTRVAGIFFDQGARGKNRCLVHFFDGHAVVQIALGLGHDRVGLDVGAQAFAGGFDQRLQTLEIERHALAAVEHGNRGLRHGDGRNAQLRALLRAAFAIQHVGPRHFMMAAAHQTQLDLVLHVFDVEGAAARTRTQQRTNDHLGQAVHRFANAGRCRTLRAVNREKGFHQGHGNLVRLERHDCAVAANDLIALVGRRRRGCGGGDSLYRRVGRRTGDGSLHGSPSFECTRAPQWTLEQLTRSRS